MWSKMCTIVKLRRNSKVTRVGPLLAVGGKKILALYNAKTEPYKVHTASSSAPVIIKLLSARRACKCLALCVFQKISILFGVQLTLDFAVILMVRWIQFPGDQLHRFCEWFGEFSSFYTILHLFFSYFQHFSAIFRFFRVSPDLQPWLVQNRLKQWSPSRQITQALVGEQARWFQCLLLFGN